MNAITKALTEVKFNIPSEILFLAFKDTNEEVNKVISLDDRILNKVVRPRVLVDCDLVGGTTVSIDLAKCDLTTLSNREFVIYVPKPVTNNRSIMSALSIVSNMVYSQNAIYHNISSLAMVANNMHNSLAADSTVQTSRLEVIGENCIMVEDPNMHLTSGTLRCVIANSSNMENLNPRSYLAFSKLVVLGVKSYIHNTLEVKLDQGYVYGGHELSVITNIVERYADSEELYQEQLIIVKKVLFMNDSSNMDRYIKSMLGNTI